MTEFKRLNYFTGFFMTAEDFQAEQLDHLEKRKLHNQGLHTPGILRGVKNELNVVAANGLNVRVLPGAALFGDGTEVYLDEPYVLPIKKPDASQRVYIALSRQEELTDYVENVQAKQYSGFTRTTEIPVLQVVDSKPDNRDSIELARIDLQVGAIEPTSRPTIGPTLSPTIGPTILPTIRPTPSPTLEVSNPADPAHPQPNEINRLYVVWAGASKAEEELTPEWVEQIALLMSGTREDFAALDGRFPVPSASDVRHAALTVEMLARSGGLHLGQLSSMLASIAAVEQDVEQEIGKIYPVLTTLAEYGAYVDAVAGLLAALRAGRQPDELFNRQGEVSDAARELSDAVILAPIAEAGQAQTVVASGGEATVTLDASASSALGGRSIAHYRWEVAESIVNPPVASAGQDRTVNTPEDQVTVMLDASGSHALGGRGIVGYRWDEPA